MKFYNKDGKTYNENGVFICHILPEIAKLDFETAEEINTNRFAERPYEADEILNDSAKQMIVRMKQEYGKVYMLNLSGFGDTEHLEFLREWDGKTRLYNNSVYITLYCTEFITLISDHLKRGDWKYVIDNLDELHKYSYCACN